MIDCRECVLGETGPREIIIIRCGGTAVASEVDSPHIEVLRECRHHRQVTLGMKAGRMADHECWPAATEVVKR